MWRILLSIFTLSLRLTTETLKLGQPKRGNTQTAGLVNSCVWRFLSFRFSSFYALLCLDLSPLCFLDSALLASKSHALNNRNA
jgi:hypothetical protein